MNPLEPKEELSLLITNALKPSKTLKVPWVCCEVEKYFSVRTSNVDIRAVK